LTVVPNGNRNYLKVRTGILDVQRLGEPFISGGSDAVESNGLGCALQYGPVAPASSKRVI
jgi:hypothetical protein